MSTFTNREDPDEMQHITTLHFINLYTVYKGKKDHQTKEYNSFLIITGHPGGKIIFSLTHPRTSGWKKLLGTSGWKKPLAFMTLSLPFEN